MTFKSSISWFLARVYWILSIIGCFRYWIIFRFRRLNDRNYTYQELFRKFVVNKCETVEDVETQLITYYIPDKNFRATLERKLKGLSLFYIIMGFDDYINIIYANLFKLEASVENYKLEQLDIPKEIYKHGFERI